MRVIDKTEKTLSLKNIKFVGYIKRDGKKYGIPTFILYFEYYNPITKSYEDLPKIRHTSKDFNIVRYSNLVGVRGCDRSVCDIRKDDIFTSKDVEKVSKFKDELIEKTNTTREELHNQVVVGKIGMKEYREFSDTHVTMNVKRFISELYEQDVK